MIDVCIYGDEKLSDEMKDIIERIACEPAESYLEKLAGSTPKKSADSFISLAAKIDYLWTGNNEDYYKNIAAILFSLAGKKGFHDSLLEARRDYENLPSRANFLVAAQ